MRGFRELLAASGHALTVPQLDLMEFHYDLLVRWAPRVNLTTVSGVEEIAKRHFVESLTVASVLPPGELSVVDAGSGAGFPGFPIAAVRPECRVSLLDSDLKKYVFLREVAERYPNVKVFRGRFEDFQEKCDWVVSRAVRWQDLEKLCSRVAQNVAVLESADDAAAIRSATAGRMEWRYLHGVLVGK